MSKLRQLVKAPLRRAATMFAAQLGPHRWPMGQRLWILMYHRVLPASDARAMLEEPGMMVTPETFDMQMRLVKDRFEVVPLEDWISARIRGESLPARACAVTFDDGWRDNYEYAWPILSRHRLPATIFLVTDYVGTRRRFWPNRVAHLLRLAGDDWRQAPALGWLARQAPRDANGAHGGFNEALSRAVQACKALPEAALMQHLHAAETAFGAEAAPAEPDLLDWAEVREMESEGLVRFGSHTRRHKRLLSDLTDDVLEDEIAGSKRILAEKLARPASLFCYPNGDYCPSAAAHVARHYSAAVVTERGINTRVSPLPELRRIGVHEDATSSRAAFLARLSTWR